MNSYLYTNNNSDTTIHGSGFSNKKSKIKNMDIENKWLQYSLVHKFEKLADYYNISRGARGLEKPTTSDEGFVRVYEKVNGDYNKLKNIPLRKDIPNGANWFQMRNVRVKAKLGQMKTMKIPLYHTSGKLKGLPTKMHTILIIWAYSPDEINIKKLGKNLDKILKAIN
jgi:hypothetical protein